MELPSRAIRRVCSSVGCRRLENVLGKPASLSSSCLGLSWRRIPTASSTPTSIEVASLKILDQITWGENNGFDDVWLSEHHFIEDGYLPSILPLAAAIAARTKRIRIASGVLLTPFHNPVRLAEDVAVVDVISGGRFELGAGVGF
jgi:alkanesulfonate monooxygenase SsuD/methylene tetrahydromethanopterin reductase-like flavin-dependent oxidoreductase (luciferase family)